MIIFPAIDLKNGKCVRLFKGDMTQSVVFSNNPLDQAKIFQDQGFKYLHLVNLDAAFYGASKNSVNDIAIKNIVKNITIPVQLGGGIRSITEIEKWLEIGVSRIIIGTVALENKELLIEATEKFPHKISVAIDAKDGFVAVKGWVKISKIAILDLVKEINDLKLANIIYTDIERDGAFLGPNIQMTQTIADNTKIPVIASGGVSSILDIEKIFALKNSNIAGVIIGRALYENKITIAEIKKYFVK